MHAPYTRRGFLADVGRGMLVAAVGYNTATELGLSRGFAADAPGTLEFGPLEPLVRFMQETPVDKLLPALADKLKAGADLRRLVAAAALANARTFGGEDYVGFHTMMALAPSLHMARELPEALQPLPVFKVLYRNTNRIQEKGGRNEEVLHLVKPAALGEGRSGAELLREAVHRKDVSEAERTFATLAHLSADDALNQLLHTVQDNTEVHRVVLPYRAWDLLDLIGRDHAHTLLRQSVRYCVRAESWPHNGSQDEPRTLLPKLLEEHKLLDRAPGARAAEDNWVDQLSQTIFQSTPEQAAEAAAAALAEGFSPAAVGEAISLAANQLILRDMGRRPRDEVLGKPLGSVHGALHAEKYYRTVTEEFAATRPAFRWRTLVALARVTASEYGRPAAGMAEAREVLKV